MSFGAPWMLWALPLVAVPIVIHLLQRRRYQRVEFGAMEFLRRAMRRMRRRVLLEDVLLLALRTLAILIAILALARPGADAAPTLLARAARSEIVVLDASLSMNHRSAGESAFERAVTQAAARLAEADPRRGARGAVIVAGLRAERIAVGEPDAARAALLALPGAGAGRADLAGACEAALRTAEDFGAGAPPRVTLYSDMQASSWDLARLELPALARLGEAGVPVEIVDVGAQQRDNVAVTEIALGEGRWIQGDALEFSVRIRNFGASATEVQAECFLDGDPVASETLRLDALGVAEWPLQLQPRAIGSRAVEIRISHDGLAEDDARAAAFELIEALDLALFGEPAVRDEAPGTCDALLSYLDLGEGAPLRPVLHPVAALDATALAEVEIAILADPGRVDLAAARALVEFLDAGGGLLVALGPRTGPEDLAALREALAAPVELLPVRRAGDPFARLRVLDPDHPALRFFREPRWLPLLTEVPFASWRPLRAEAGARAVLAFARDTELADEGLALVEHDAGAGTVAWLAAAPCSLWNRMEEVPSGTLALLYDLLFHLAPRSSQPSASEVGAPLELMLAAAPTEVVLRDPAGARVATQPAWSAAAGARRTTVRLLEAAEASGVWRAELTVPLRDGGEERRELRLAVHSPAEESDLRPVDAEALRAQLPPGIALASPSAAEDAADATADQRHDWSGLFWRVVLALFLAETLLAAFLDRRRQ